MTEPSRLEYAKLVAEYLTPIATALFGYWILRATKRIESSRWKTQKLVEKRIEVWEKAGPWLNDVHC